MIRWILLCTPWFAVYLHHFIRDDPGDLHDHPRGFVSIGLWGEYWEKTPLRLTLFRAPWVRQFPPERRHRILLTPGATCWTLAIAGPRVREWGFWETHSWGASWGTGYWENFTPWRQYVVEHGGVPEEKPSCP